MVERTGPRTSSDDNRTAEAMRSRIENAAAGMRVLEAEALTAAIEYTRAGFHRSFDGYSGLLDWVRSSFDFNHAVAAQIARIARLAAKFTVLAEAALSGGARVDAVAYAVRKLDVTGLRVWARAPYSTPVPSPYDSAVQCPTPEALIAEHCTHASFSELKDAIAQLLAARESEREAMLDDMAQATLQRLDLWRTDDGMWSLDATLTETTGRLLDNYLKTAVKPPRAEEADQDGVLPPSANRNAEAFHQLLAAAGTDPSAPTRHGHTATLTLMADLDTLRGQTTGRLPRLEGEPISVARARLLACEAGVVPMVFDYTNGEVIEQSRELRVPNTALRRKLEAEQQGGCAWHGCGRPVSWCESHHIEHWIDGGKTVPENLILLCRFHHGRIHTGEWAVTKTGPGQAIIEHISNGMRDTDWDLADEETPTGLYPDEYAPAFRRQLDDLAAEGAVAAATEAIRRARETYRAQQVSTATPTETDRPDTAPPPRTTPDTPDSGPQLTSDCALSIAPAAAPPPVLGEHHSARDPIPF